MLLLKRFAEWRRKALPKPGVSAILHHYLPVTGAISHSLFTVHIFSPSLLQRLFPLYDSAIEHSILSTSNVGLGFYLYYRPHLKRLSAWDRVEYSALATMIFNFGSLLAAIFLKALLPSKSSIVAKSVLAVCISWYFLSRGHKYVNSIDSSIKQKNNTQRKKVAKPLGVLTAI